MEEDFLLFCDFLKSVDRFSGVVERNAETQADITVTIVGFFGTIFMGYKKWEMC